MPNKLLFSKTCIEVECPRGDTEVPGLLANIYPVHSNRTRTNYKISIHKTPEVLKLMRGIDEQNIDTAPQSIQDFFYSETRTREQVADLLRNGPKNSCVVNDNLTLMRHQQLGREIAKLIDRYAFYYDTRTGKTPMSLAIMHDDIVANPAHKWLVICPLILIDNAWLEDAARFVPDLTLVNCHATTPQQRQANLAREANIYVTNVESFAKYQESFEAKGFHGCIVDESSTMKSTSSKVGKAIVAFAQTMRQFYLLSGTPAPNGEWEYYRQLQSIDFFSVPQSYTQFKQYFFVNLSYNPQYEKLALRPDRKEELYGIIRNYAYYVDKEDVLTTPGRTFIELEIEMPMALKKQYTSLKDKLYLELEEEGRSILAKSAAAKLNKLNQVSSGFVIDTQAVKENKFYADHTATEWFLLDNYRFEKLRELLASANCAGEQVLIWANYRAEFKVIQDYLGQRCACIYGGTTIAEKTDAIRRFRGGAVQYLVANPASADKGLTLTNCHIAVYFSLNWSYELFKQSTERIYGDISRQPNHCLYYIFIARGTVDRILYSDVLQGKRDASYAVLNHLKPGGTLNASKDP